MADDPKDGAGEGQADGTLDNRVGKLEAGQESITAKLDDLIGMLKGSEGGGESHAPEGTGSIGKEIRDQLDQRDRERAAADRDRAHGDRVGALEASLAELREKPPVPPVRRVEKVMGWS